MGTNFVKKGEGFKKAALLFSMLNKKFFPQAIVFPFLFSILENDDDGVAAVVSIFLVETNKQKFKGNMRGVEAASNQCRKISKNSSIKKSEG